MIFDDMTEPIFIQAVGIKVNFTGALGIPDMHMPIGAARLGVNQRPDAQMREYALRRSAQGADPRIITRDSGLSCQRLVKRGGVQQRNAQGRIGQRFGQRRSDHTCADNDQVVMLSQGSVPIWIDHVWIDHALMPMAWRANSLRAGGSRSRPSRPRLRPMVSNGWELLNNRVR